MYVRINRVMINDVPSDLSGDKTLSQRMIFPDERVSIPVKFHRTIKLYSSENH